MRSSDDRGGAGLSSDLHCCVSCLQTASLMIAHCRTLAGERQGPIPLNPLRGSRAFKKALALRLYRDATGRSVSAADVNMHTIRSARSFLALPSSFEPSDVIPAWSNWIAEARAIGQGLPKSL